MFHSQSLILFYLKDFLTIFPYLASKINKSDCHVCFVSLASFINSEPLMLMLCSKNRPAGQYSLAS